MWDDSDNLVHSGGTCIAPSEASRKVSLLLLSRMPVHFILCLGFSVLSCYGLLGNGGGLRR